MSVRLNENEEIVKKNREIMRENRKNRTKNPLLELKDNVPALFYKEMCEAGELKEDEEFVFFSEEDREKDDKDEEWYKEFPPIS